MSIWKILITSEPDKIATGNNAINKHSVFGKKYLFIIKFMNFLIKYKFINFIY